MLEFEINFECDVSKPLAKGNEINLVIFCHKNIECQKKVCTNNENIKRILDRIRKNTN